MCLLICRIDIEYALFYGVFLGMGISTDTRIPDPPFSSFGPSRDYGMDLYLEVYL